MPYNRAKLMNTYLSSFILIVIISVLILKDQIVVGMAAVRVK
jgi:hypothetical protein